MAQALKARIAERKSLAIIDVRDEDTFSARHLLVASCLPLSRMEVLAPRLLPRLSLPIVVCDDGNGYAELGYRRLLEAGYSDVSVLEGGISAWEKAGYRLYSGVHVVSKAFAEVVEHVCHTPYLSPEQVKEKIDRRDDIVIFDSRSFEEYHSNSIPTATSVPSAELVYRIQDLVTSPETEIIVNCGGRTRSIIGAQALRNAGVPNPVYSLANGTMGWVLSGFETIKGATRSAPELSNAALEVAASRAKEIAERSRVQMIDKAALAGFQRESSDVCLHIIDVRSSKEFDAGHLPGSLNCAGGQLVQETDNWIADFQARIVLVDDTLVRSIVTASWLSQMGYPNVYVLTSALNGAQLETGRAVVRADFLPFPLKGPEPAELQPTADLASTNQWTFVDVSLSKAYLKSHIPGAWHAVRSRLSANLAKLPQQRALVFTSEDGVLARHAAAETAAATGQKTYVLAGGNAAWNSANLPTEVTPVNLLDEPDDVWYAPRDRKTDLERHMREYLSWEIDLAQVVGSDGDCQFQVIGGVHGA